MYKNEAFALACLERYAEEGLVVDSTNGEFAHCPYPKGMGETGYYLLWEHHQQQGLYQSEDFNRVCFFKGHVKNWLQTCNYWPDDFFELWDIYDKWSKAVTYRNPETGECRQLTSEQAKEWGWLGVASGKGVYLNPDSGKYVLIKKEEAQKRGWVAVNTGTSLYRNPDTEEVAILTKEDAADRGWIGINTGKGVYRDPETGETSCLTKQEAEQRGWVGVNSGKSIYKDPETGETSCLTKQEAKARGWVGISSGTRHKQPLKTCPHCGLTGGERGMTRYHFDNCKRRE